MRAALPRRAGAVTMPAVRALRVLQQQSESLRARVHAEVASRLDGPATPETLVDAATLAHAAMDDAGARVLAHGARQPACAAGCSHCCHVHADATVPEILAIVAHLAASWTEEAREALRERLARQASLVAHLDDQERWAARIPCALLDGAGLCSIHAARPLRCRAFHSCAVEPCREAFAGRSEAGPDRIARLDQAHDAVEQGYDGALAGSGVSAAGHRLEMALLLALDDPDAGRRWLAAARGDGEDPFARARPPGP